MKPCVLIVDDSLTVRMDLKDAFEAAGFDTITCATLETARRACQEQPFDVAILDVILPDGDGVTFLKEIKSAPAMAGRAVLLLSSEDEVRDRVRGLKTGADDYVGKPYNTAQVIARARELVQRRRIQTRERPMIVLIEDSPTFAYVLQSALEEAGYEVAVGASGEEGLQLVANLRPDAVVVDQVLPGLGGPEVVRRLRADAALRRTPCVMLTASEDRADELRALEAGADAFGQKSAAPAVVLARLTPLLRMKRKDTEGEALSSLLAPKRILAVDDSVTFLHELCDQLRAEGYDAVAARSGQEALELLGTQPVDGILLDLLMPGMSGQETCRRIKAEPAWRDIPLIILTALGEDAAMIEGINAGADDYISKSGDFDILKARLRAQMRRRQFEDENRHVREQLHRREMETVEMQALRELSETRAKLIADLEGKNEQLRIAKKAADEAKQELESFSYSVSHDLRAPLRAIDGFSQMLVTRVGSQLDAQASRHLQHVRESAQHMGQLIEDMLNLARVTRQDVRREKVDLGETAGKIFERLRLVPPGDRVVEIVIADDLTTEGDRGLLSILLENLLGNAWKFTSKREQARIEFGQQPGADGTSVFHVRDNGAGFDMKYAEKLFGAFQRMHRADEFPGTGVGLATVARVIRRHGGRIWAESVLGQGTTFFFTLGGPGGGTSSSQAS